MSCSTALTIFFGYWTHWLTIQYQPKWYRACTLMYLRTIRVHQLLVVFAPVGLMVDDIEWETHLYVSIKHSTCGRWLVAYRKSLSEASSLVRRQLLQKLLMRIAVRCLSVGMSEFLRNAPGFEKYGRAVGRCYCSYRYDTMSIMEWSVWTIKYWLLYFAFGDKLWMSIIRSSSVTGAWNKCSCFWWRVLSPGGT